MPAVTEIFVIIKRDKFVGKAMIKQLRVEDTALRHQMAQADIIVFGKHIDVGDTCAPRLPTGV